MYKSLFSRTLYSALFYSKIFVKYLIIIKTFFSRLPACSIKHIKYIITPNISWFHSNVTIAAICYRCSIITFNYFPLPHPGDLHFHVPEYYIYAIPVSLIFVLIFLIILVFDLGLKLEKEETHFQNLRVYWQKSKN